MNSDKTSSGAPLAGLPADAPNRRRRRLIVGAASIVPSVYTLTSGAQVAANSSLRCLEAYEDVEPTRFVNQTDHWLRAPVQVGNFENRNSFCVSSPQSECTDPLNTSQAGSGSQWVVEGVDNNSVMAGPGAPIQVSQGQHAYGLVYVDKQGTVTALDPGYTGDLYPCTNSCWASVMSSRSSGLG